MEITLPEIALVVLLGASGSGKSTFAQNHFRREDILSQERFLRMVAGSQNDPKAHEDASEALSFILEKRLKNGLLTVIDGRHVSQASRKPLRQMAKKNHVDMVGIWLDLPEEVLRGRLVEGTTEGMAQVRQQKEQLEKYDLGLKAEGFLAVHRLRSEAEIDEVSIAIKKLPSNYKTETGPFDLIGDVHGCYEELVGLLGQLGYELKTDKSKLSSFKVIHPEGRRVIFVGDLVDRGPDSTGVLKLVMDMVEDGVAYCVTGNHDDKFKRHLMGRKVKVAHGLEVTLAQMEEETEEFADQVKRFLQRLPDHMVLDQGALTVAHAGLREVMQGRQSGAVRSFCLYGETTGESDEFGLPVRHNWAGEYQGRSMVVYGHTPVPEAIWQNQTINIDTGCVFGGALTALRFPEREIVSVPAARIYSEPKRPLALNLPKPEQDRGSGLVDFERVAGRNLISTRHQYFITIKDAESPAVLEMLQYGRVNPKLLIYIPPRLSPTKSSKQPGYLEHTTEAFAYYAKKGQEKVLVEKSMGGEQVTIVIAKDEVKTIKIFNTSREGLGSATNSIGHEYFKTKEQEQRFLKRFRDVLDQLDLWNSFKSDWFCITGEMTPGTYSWGDLPTSYQRIATAGETSLNLRKGALQAAMEAGLDVEKLAHSNTVQEEYLQKFKTQLSVVDQPHSQLDHFCFTPTFLLASEGKTYFDKDQLWHRSIWDDLESKDELFCSPSYRWVDLDSEEEKREASQWFESISNAGGGGVIVRPSVFCIESGGDLIQPGLAVRGREYLRLIYGPDYDSPERLEQYRLRRLKDIRQLTVRQMALGMEALHRFVEKQDLTSVFECNYALLSLQTRDLDPRL